jgi:hypothetical protein
LLFSALMLQALWIYAHFNKARNHIRTCCQSEWIWVHEVP